MNKPAILTKATRVVHRAGFQLKKHSPEILIVAGVIGTVTSAVMACHATTKVSAILEQSRKDIDDIHRVTDNPELRNGETYTLEDSKKDLTIVYARTAVQLVKLYAPSVALGALSLTGIITSNQILRKRNIALAAAYATVDRSFKTYRGRIIDRFGEELDREIRYNIKAKEIEETIVDENGKEKKVKKTVNVMSDPNLYSEYARIFDDGCIGWDKNAEYNLMFVRQMQNTANDLLKSRGHLFLNEVYDMFGFPRTEAGQIVGWLYDEDAQYGDNFVDFGVYDIYNEKARDFVNGRERVIVLDFNVDGDILHNL